MYFIDSRNVSIGYTNGVTFRDCPFVDIIFQRYSFYPRKSYVPQNHEVEAGVQNPVIIKYINFYLFYGISCIRLLLAERNGGILK